MKIDRNSFLKKKLNKAMEISAYQFGKVRIDTTTATSDVIVYPEHYKITSG
jgi:hypothetical protein